MPAKLLTTPFAATTLSDLIANLQVKIEGKKQIVISVANLISTNEGATSYFHEVTSIKREEGQVMDPVEYLEFVSAEEADQRLEMEEVLSQGNAPVCYSQLTFLDAKGAPITTNIFFYRPDGGAWLQSVSKPAIDAAIVNDIPWEKAKRSATTYQGLSKEGISYFEKAGGDITAVVTITDADIDTDGPGGSKAIDRYWQPHTSLRDSHGNSCNSREFLGVVIPPGLTREFGIHMGDFALLSWKNKQVPVQVYDGGPSAKIGEISFAAALALDIGPKDEKTAATKGNSVKDLMTVFFPGSGSSRAVSSELTAEAVKKCRESWLGAAAPGAAPAPAVGQQTFAQFIASLNLKHVNLEHVLGTTGKAPNTMPVESLWQNIVPTLVVLDAVVESLGGGKLRVNSTYRNVAYNNVVGGAKRSQHAAFRAVDFSIDGRTPESIAAAVKSMRGQQFAAPLAHLQLTNVVDGLPSPPPLNLSALSLNSTPAGTTTFVYHGGVQDYDSFVHMDCRGDDVSWG
ncbi:MAG: hypothetical protein J0L73_27495 [Verrucomicrobia bacterium]|nr:hypothetical protein [Verrucomicrobiota bacterium]